MNLPFSLFRLQNLDTQINQMQKHLQEIERILLQDERVKSALENLEKSAETLKNQKRALVLIEDQVETKQIKLKLTQASLFGGRISNPKELQDLQQEGEALKRTISKLEEDQLSCMIAVEEAQIAQQQADADYKQAIADKISQNANLMGEKSKLESELPSLESQRDSIVQGIPAETRTLYESLIKSKAGKAVAEVIDECCDACGATLTPGELQSARSPSTLLKCRTCGRILFKR